MIDTPSIRMYTEAIRQLLGNEEARLASARRVAGARSGDDVVMTFCCSTTAVAAPVPFFYSLSSCHVACVRRTH